MFKHYKYNQLNYISEGSYGNVWVVNDKTTDTPVAMKVIGNCLRSVNDSRVILKEIYILMALQYTHINIINIYDIFIYNKDICIIFELMDTNLYQMIQYPPRNYNETYVKYILNEILNAINFMHTNHIMHRDIKPQNILIKNNQIKICDFGLSKLIEDEKDVRQPLTDHVVTRWYRAPEVILKYKNYSYPIDIWSIGCIFAELLLILPNSSSDNTKSVLFPGKSDFSLSPTASRTIQSDDQLIKIIEVIGEISQSDLDEMDISSEIQAKLKTIKINKTADIDSIFDTYDISCDCINLLKKMLIINPKNRITADQALSDSYFIDIVHDGTKSEYSKPNESFLQKTKQVENKTINNIKNIINNLQENAFSEPPLKKMRT